MYKLFLFLLVIGCCTFWGLADDFGQKPLEIKIPQNDLIIDSRDGKGYLFIQIGDLYWFKENLKYVSPESECYDSDEENCKKFGRLYSYLDSKTACPQGWHLPTVKEWKSLKKAVGGTEADKIIVPGEWEGEDFEGANNELNLSILPGGRKDEKGPPRPSKFGEKGISSSYWLDHTQFHWHIRWGKSHVHKHGDIATQGRKFYIRCVCEVDKFNQ